MYSNYRSLLLDADENPSRGRRVFGKLMNAAAAGYLFLVVANMFPFNRTGQLNAAWREAESLLVAGIGDEFDQPGKADAALRQAYDKFLRVAQMNPEKRTPRFDLAAVATRLATLAQQSSRFAESDEWFLRATS